MVSSVDVTSVVFSCSVSSKVFLETSGVGRICPIYLAIGPLAFSGTLDLSTTLSDPFRLQSISWSRNQRILSFEWTILIAKATALI